MRVNSIDITYTIERGIGMKIVGTAFQIGYSSRMFEMDNLAYNRNV
jgi:hypothetical protein